MITSYTAGGIVVSDKGNVLVVNQNGKSWSLPKGHIDPGETAQEAAIREIEEESGITNLEFVKELGAYKRYRIGINGGEEKSELKNIQLFLYKTPEVKPYPQDPDNPEARWVSPDEVVNILTHEKDKEFYLSKLHEVKQLIDM